MKPRPRRTLDIIIIDSAIKNLRILHIWFTVLPNAVEGYANVGEDVEESHLCAEHVNHGEHTNYEQKDQSNGF